MNMKVGILSLGDMGVGIAKLLIAHDYQVLTNCQGRSEDTIKRAKEAKVEIVDSDLELVQQCSVILSVVPPKDAEATAQRIIDALSGSDRKGQILYFADLNAVSPRTSKGIAELFERARSPVRFIDGCILGGPPRLKTGSDPGTNITMSDQGDSDWTRPRLPVSGPHSLSDLEDGSRLTSVLNMYSISPDIGAASGLKMCFAAMTKGYTALATQSFTTAHRLGVADELRESLSKLSPPHLTLAEKGVPAMPPKAWRWIKEMEEIAGTMNEEGGWDRELFDGIAGIYRDVAGDKVLGKEKAGKRSRGTSLEDVAAARADGLQTKRKKVE